MAENKNQHFVHKGYLKPFCVPENPKTIAVLNISRNLYIPSSPVKSECSKSYFYGKSPELEGLMQELEGGYNAVIKNLCTPGYSLTESDRKSLLRFWLFQHSRTEAKAKQGVQMASSMADAYDVDPNENNFDQKKAIETGLDIFLSYNNRLDDLKVRLLKNKTKNAFITSDDPAILCNKWYQVDPRPKRYNFGGGLGSSGTVLILPLTPTILFVAFDGDVYSLPHKNNWANTTSVMDVNAFNQQQHLNCFKNIYCVDEENYRVAKNELENTKARRLTQKYEIEYMVEEDKFPIKGQRLVAILEDGTRFVEVTKEEARQTGSALVRSRRVFPEPPIWPRILKLRPKGSVYTNGSYGGFMRKAHAELKVMFEPDMEFWREPSVFSTARFRASAI